MAKESRGVGARHHSSSSEARSGGGCRRTLWSQRYALRFSLSSSVTRQRVLRETRRALVARTESGPWTLGVALHVLQNLAGGYGSTTGIYRSPVPKFIAQWGVDGLLAP